MAVPEHPDFSRLELGRPHEPVEVDTRDAVREASAALVAQARREVVIMSRHLDAPLYDDPAFARVMQEFVLQHRRTRVRILVKDTEKARREGHRVVALAQHLTSYMAIRVPAHEFHAYNAAFLIADRCATVYRPMADRYESTVAFGDRKLAGELMRQFDEMWESARADAGLRRVHL